MPLGDRAAGSGLDGQLVAEERRTRRRSGARYRVSASAALRARGGRARSARRLVEPSPTPSRRASRAARAWTPNCAATRRSRSSRFRQYRAVRSRPSGSPTHRPRDGRGCCRARAHRRPSAARARQRARAARPAERREPEQRAGDRRAWGGAWEPSCGSRAMSTNDLCDLLLYALVMLDVRRLRVLREVARRGSFSAAAEALSFTQPAISRQIAALELEAGTQLVDRRARGVRLTPAGELLLEHADVILDRLADGRDPARGARRPGRRQAAPGRVRHRQRDADPARDPRVRRPSTRPSSCGSSRAGRRSSWARMLGGEVDLAVLAIDRAEEEIELEPLMDDPLFVALAADHPLAGKPELCMADLSDETWIESRRGASLGRADRRRARRGLRAAHRLRGGQLAGQAGPRGRRRGGDADPERGARHRARGRRAALARSRRAGAAAVPREPGVRLPRARRSSR